MRTLAERDADLRARLTIVGKSMAMQHYFSTGDLDGGDSPVITAENIDERAACFDAVEAFVASLSHDEANDRDYGSVVDAKYGSDPTQKPQHLPGIVWENYENFSAQELLETMQGMVNNVIYNAEDADLLVHTFTN